MFFFFFFGGGVKRCKTCVKRGVLGVSYFFKG